MPCQSHLFFCIFFRIKQRFDEKSKKNHRNGATDRSLNMCAIFIDHIVWPKRKIDAVERERKKNESMSEEKCHRV